jgi:hypothetical protein
LRVRSCPGGPAAPAAAARAGSRAAQEGGGSTLLWHSPCCGLGAASGAAPRRMAHTAMTQATPQPSAGPWKPAATVPRRRPLQRPPRAAAPLPLTTTPLPPPPTHLCHVVVIEVHGGGGHMAEAGQYVVLCRLRGGVKELGAVRQHPAGQGEGGGGRGAGPLPVQQSPSRPRDPACTPTRSPGGGRPPCPALLCTETGGATHLLLASSCATAMALRQ